jgi:hypothetical protein
MDPAKEQHYLRMAMDHPGILCSEAPLEILEAAASEGEPTRFMEEYFALGHSRWLAEKHGRSIHLPKDQMDRAILVLWLRACLLNTDRLLHREIRDADMPFFSDEGFYGSP